MLRSLQSLSSPPPDPCRHGTLRMHDAEHEVALVVFNVGFWVRP